MDLSFAHVPAWLIPIGWTAATVGVAYILGHLVNAFVATRLATLATRTRAAWDDILIGELRRRIPFWSLLIGAWLALAHWSLSSQSLRFAEGLLSTLAVGSVTFAAASMATRLVTAYSTALKPPVPVSGLTLNLVRIFITTLGILVIIKGLGRDITPMLTALGVGGLAVALALQDPLSNLFAGIVTSIAGQVRLGDYIRLDSGIEGQIIDFNWRATRLQSLAGHVVIVPNAKLAQAVVNNYSVPRPDVPVGLEVTAEFKGDLDLIERVALDVASDVMRTVPGGVVDAEPAVRFHSFGDFGVKFTVGLRARAYADQGLVKHEFVKRLHARFVQEGITIPTSIPAPARSGPAAGTA